MKILLIRLRLLGDVVFTTPAIRAIRELYPTAHLTYLVEPPAAAVVARHPLLDEVIVTPRERGVARIVRDLALIADLRRKRFDVVVDFHGGPRSTLLARASGAPVRIGYQVTGRSWMYTTVVERPRELRARHSVVNQWDLVTALAGSRTQPPDPCRHRTEMGADSHADARVMAWLAERGLAGQELLVAHVSAGNVFRRWPVSSFIDLIATLARDPRRAIVLTAGPSDAEAAAEIRRAAVERAGPDADRRILTGDDFNLPELRALIAYAALFIGGDSGPLHVASTTNTPIVGLYGPTLVERSGPWRDARFVNEAVDAGPLPCRPCHQRHCEPGDFRCLTGISPARVRDAVERALARRTVNLERHPA